MIASSRTYSRPSNVRVSFGGEDTVTLPESSYLHGRPPSATWVPPPVAVKNAAIPEPPARIRSASVPCGVSSTSSSPERYCRANSLFSPTYDAIIRRNRFSASNRPRPHSSTPQLFETASRSVVPASRSASISTDGIPHNPKPPTDSVAPSGMSATASAALPTTLSTSTPPCRDPAMRGVPEVTPGHTLPAATLVRMPAPRAESAPDFPGVQLHIVTGKGGTGKSTVSAALALALASRGNTVLLCEVEGRQGIAQLFDVPPLPYEERRVARGTTGAGDVYAMAIDAESALLEYLDMYYRLGRAGKALDRFGVIEFATTIAPGVRDVLLTGKVYEAANRNRRNKGAREYDAIVLDAPPTGRISQFLNVNTELAGLAKVGPIKSQADVVMKLLRSSRTAIHLVTVLEEMPVQETGDGIAELKAAELPVGGVIVNMVRPQDLDADERARLLDGTVDREALVTSLEKAGISADDELVDGLLEEGHDHAERRQLEDSQRALVEQLGVPTYELLLMPGGVDLAGLYELAEALCEGGLA